MKKNNENKPYIIPSDEFYDTRINPMQTSYKINVDKIKTIKDIKLILKHLDLTYSPKSKEQYKEIKHLLILD